jgi:purine-binding chemotaxis protein CheW
MEHRLRHDPSKSLVGFVVDDVHYAVAIARVREIANPAVTVALPGAPHGVVGVTDYRGEVIPVVDLRLRFALPAAPATRRTKWIVVDAVGRLMALVVDAATEVFGTGGAELRPAPSLARGDDVRGIEAVATRDGSLVFVLDPGRLRDLVEPLAAAGQIGQGAAVASLPAGTRT